MTAQLKTSSGDLVIDDGFLQIVSGRESLAQTIAQRLQTSRGEWRYNLSHGIPYIQVIARKAGDDLVKAIMREAILETPGVQSITRLEVTRDRVTRTLTVSGEVIGTDNVIARFAPVQIEAGGTINGDG